MPDREPRVPWRGTRSCRRGERGIVLVWMALTLTILLMFAGFMVDLGAWYQQSQDLQRASDAAALAGSTYLPDNPGPAGGDTPANCGTSVANIETSTPTNAYCAALKSVYKNGFTNATVTAVQDGSDNRQLDVTVQQGNISQYFTSFFMGPLTFSVSSHAQFSQPVDLGSPQNYFGTGTLEGYTGFEGTGNSTNFWAMIGGYCDAKASGDEYVAGYDGNVADVHNGTYAAAADCNPTTDPRISNPTAACSASTTPPENCEFDPLGYQYTITVPSTAPSNATLWVYNAAFNPCLSPPEYNGSGALLSAPQSPALPPLIDTDWNLSLNYPCGSSGVPANATSITTYYTMSSPNGTVVTVAEAPQYTKGGGFPAWTNVFAGKGVTLSPGNTYILNVSTLDLTSSGGALASTPLASDGTRSWGLHNYGLMVTTSAAAPTNTNGANFVCSGATCPVIYANTSTAMGATIVSPVCTSSCTGTGAAATAYLADIPAADIGKTVTLKVWNPGDYASYMQVMQPDGTPLPSFGYKVYGADPDAASLYGGTIPPPNNTTDPGNPDVTSCTDPLTGSTLIDPTTGAAVTTPCFAVDGCVTSATNLTLTTCDTAAIGTPAWGGPNNRYGMAPYYDSLVEITFTAEESGWFGLKEVSGQPLVHNSITVNLVVDGLPPHLTP